jgi:hypothetical protein
MSSMGVGLGLWTTAASSSRHASGHDALPLSPNVEPTFGLRVAS